MIRVADYIIKRIEEIGIQHVFLVTGRGVLYLTDALAANSNLQSISTHHEQGAAYAAYAYSEYTGNMGACLVSTGCAATNAITGVMCAWQDDVPIIVISGQNMLNETTYHTHSGIRTYGQQENDIIALVKPITKYAVMLEQADDVAYVMDQAFYEAQHGRMGPVWVDVPLDIQNQRVEEDRLRRYIPEEKELDDLDISLVADMILESERPVILIGSGIRRDSAIEELIGFVTSHYIPLVYDASAVDIYTNENALSIGAVGSMSGTRAGNFAIQNSDLVLDIGCRLSTMLTGNEREKFARDAKIIVVDIDENELETNRFRTMVTVKADSKRFIKQLGKQMERNNRERTEWIKTCQHWKKIFPKNIYKNTLVSGGIDMYDVAEAIGQYADSDAIAITDAGMEELIFPVTMCLKQNARVIHPVSQGAMGFAIPAIVGAYLASKKQVISVVGDGSIMMNLQELQTIKFNDIPAKIIVINNNCYAVIRSRQKELFRNRTIGTDPSDGVTVPSFEKVSECFGFEYVRITQREELNQKINEVLSANQAVICEIVCKEDQQFLKNSYAMNKKHRLLRRSLEDQYPFLDRDIIRKEMLIEPIEMD